MKTQPTYPTHDGIQLDAERIDRVQRLMKAARDQHVASESRSATRERSLRWIQWVPYAAAAVVALGIFIGPFDSPEATVVELSSEEAWAAVEDGYVDIDLEDLSYALSDEDLSLILD